MHSTLYSRITAVGAVFCLSSVGADALVSFNDGRDKAYVTGAFTYGYDSNLYASSGGKGDYYSNATVTAEYSRRAGLIGVDASLGVSASRFDKQTSENFSNPKASLEFTKQAGRTTGSLLLTAARESRADSAANIRNESWNYASSLNFRYPVIERYSISGGVGYSKRDFQYNETLVDLEAFTANLDLFYVYTSERDLIAGYRFRRENTSASSTNTDHAFSLGLSGKVLPKLNGSVRAGYQVRNTAGSKNEDFSSWFASSSLTWSVAKRVTVTGTISKDFSTTSTNTTSDTLSGQLSSVYSLSSNWSFSANVAAGFSRFLGVEANNRNDFYTTYGFDVNYTLNQHLKASLGYTWFRNWSTEAFSDFTREGYTLMLTSRW